MSAAASNSALSTTVASRDFAHVASPSLRSGRGYMKYPDGTLYEGEWLLGDRHGLGICYFPSGNIYIGEFKKGSMEGSGTMLFASGEYFTGQFRDSVICSGTYGSSGREVRGTWDKSVCVAQRPLAVSEDLQAAHATLFSRLLEQVHAHFECYNADEPAFAEVLALADVKVGDSPMDFSSESVRHMGMTATPTPSLTGHSPEKVAALSTTSRVPAPTQEMHAEVRTGGAPAATSARGASASMRSIFSSASPASNAYFSILRFSKYVFVFLFPFLSLPWMPLAPLPITTLETEREFVVSGATLRRDFDPPTFAIYVVAVSFCCQLTSIIIVACKVTLGDAQDGRLTLPEMVIPCVLWLVVALFSASYHSFFRVPHTLERLDRKLTPRLSAFAADVVDAQARVVIYTWDEEGSGRIMNRHYRYRWLLFSVLLGAMMSLSAPSTRGGFGHNMFGDKGFEMAAALLAFFATFFLSAQLSYYVLKLTDMQREICEKLRVLSNLAYIGGRSFTRPSTTLLRPFNLDEPVDPNNFFSGFPGWYVTRSLILYASTSANHEPRGYAMGVFAFTMFSVMVVAVLDTFYCVLMEYTKQQGYYSTAHSYGFFVLLFWGLLFVRYMYTCLATMRERQRHLYIMDAASMTHAIERMDQASSEIISSCRNAVAAHDVVPIFFEIKITPLLVATLVFLNLAGLACVTFQLGEVIYY